MGGGGGGEYHLWMLAASFDKVLALTTSNSRKN